MPADKRTAKRLAERAARTIAAGFKTGTERFDTVTERARARFEQHDWHGMLADMGERLELHALEVDRLVTLLRGILHESVRDESTWVGVKVAYARLLSGWHNRELAETFFNSVSRRALSTAGINPATEFDVDDAPLGPEQENPSIYERHPCDGGTGETVRRILEGCGFAVPFENLARDAQRAARAIDAQVAATPGGGRVDAFEMVRPTFYRQKLAYLIGRIRAHGVVLPLVLVLRHEERGIGVDAVLTTQSELSILFSFTRSHF